MSFGFVCRVTEWTHAASTSYYSCACMQMVGREGDWINVYGLHRITDRLSAKWHVYVGQNFNMFFWDGANNLFCFTIASSWCSMLGIFRSSFSLELVIKIGYFLLHQDLEVPGHQRLRLAPSHQPTARLGDGWRCRHGEAGRGGRGCPHGESGRCGGGGEVLAKGRGRGLGNEWREVGPICSWHHGSRCHVSVPSPLRWRRPTTSVPRPMAPRRVTSAPKAMALSPGSIKEWYP